MIVSLLLHLCIIFTRWFFFFWLLLCMIFSFYWWVTHTLTMGAWTHDLTLDPIIMEGGSGIRAGTHWHLFIIFTILLEDFQWLIVWKKKKKKKNVVCLFAPVPPSKVLALSDCHKYPCKSQMYIKLDNQKKSGDKCWLTMCTR